MTACGSQAEPNGNTGGSTTPASDTGGTDDGSCSTDLSLGDFLSCTSGGPVDLAPSNAAPPRSNVDPNSEYGYTVEEYVSFIVNEADKTWTAWFAANGYNEPFVGIKAIKPGETFVSNCTLPGGGQAVVGSDFPNAFYCPLDNIVDANGVTYEGTLILPLLTFQKMWTGDIFGKSATAGDFGAAIIVAHEFGHHVQDEIMVQFNANNPGTQVTPPNGKNKELIADCFAGVWAASAYYQGILEAGDFEEALSALGAIGDEGTSTDPHGTPSERQQALVSGYSGIEGLSGPGDPNGCIKTYWK